LGTIDHWLTERYCLYARSRSGRILRTEIHHRPWPLQPARAEFHQNDMVHSLGLSPGDDSPLLHFSRRLDVIGWAPEPT
jgi:hypothetical protein